MDMAEEQYIDRIVIKIKKENQPKHRLNIIMVSLNLGTAIWIMKYPLNKVYRSEVKEEE